MKRFLLVVLALAGSTVQAQEALRPPVPGELARQTALLHEVADLWDANLAKIKTWEGEAAITRVSVNQDGDGERREQACTATFVLDRASDQLLWVLSEGDGVVSREGKSSLEPPYNPFASGLRTSTTLTRFPTGPIKENRANKFPLIALSLPRKGARLSHYHDFDPMWYFGYSGENAAERLRFLATVLQRPDAKWRIVKFGQTVLVEFDDGHLVNRYTFRLDWGGMPASYEGIDADGSDTVKWKFARQGEVWLPTEWSEANTKKRDEQKGDAPGPKMRSLEVKFVKNRVSEKLADDAFEFGRLGLEPGDLICDGPTNKYRKYQPAASGNDAASQK